MQANSTVVLAFRLDFFTQSLNGVSESPASPVAAQPPPPSIPN